MKIPQPLAAGIFAVLALAAACGDDAGTEIGAEPTPTENTSESGSGETTNMFTLTGTVTEQTGMSEIPEGARVVISIDDVSLQDAASVTVVTREYDDITSFPFDYELVWDEALISRNTYAVSARITVADELIFVTDTTFDVTADDAVKDFFVIPVNDTTDPAESADRVAANVVGLSEADAIAQIGAAGFSSRVVERDGEMFAGTADYREDRINLTVADDVVTVAVVG